MTKLIIPPSKSHTMRALIFALMAKGVSTIRNYLPSPDTDAMIRAISALGAKVSKENDTLFVQGTSGHLSEPQEPIDCGNSGQVLRFIAAIAALSSHPIVLTGDASITSNRLVSPLIDALGQLGAKTRYLKNHGFAPVEICGPIQSGKASLLGTDSQPISALLMALSFLSAPSEIFVHDPQEQPWIDLTLWWLKKFGATVEHHNHLHYLIHGSLQLQGFECTIPGDFSTAAFPIAASLITGKNITLDNLPLDDPQGDKEVFRELERKGAPFIFHPQGISLSERAVLQGGTIDVNPFIDALPILCVLGCFATAPTTLINALPARFKESDRLTVMSQELAKMCGRLESTKDSLTIYPSSLQGAVVFGHNDHRVAMALTIAALGAKGPSIIEGIRCIDKSYPQFVQHIQELGHVIRKPTPDTLWVSGFR